MARAPALRWATAGWTFFIAENVIISENRTEIISAFGSEKYHLAYNSLSTFATGMIGYGWFKHVRGKGPARAWALGAAAQARAAASGGRVSASGGRAAAAVALQALGIAAFAQLAPALQVPVEMQGEAHAAGGGAGAAGASGAAGAPGATDAIVTASGPAPAPAAAPTKFAVRCPFDFQAGQGGGAGDEVWGSMRVSRHATLWGLGSFCLGAAVATPLLPEACFLAMPGLVALLMGSHQDYRFRRGMGGTLSPETDARTSNIPFLALLTGAQEESWLGGWEKLGEEVKGLNVLAAVALALALQRGRSAGVLLPQAARAAGSRRARSAGTSAAVGSSGGGGSASVFNKRA